MLTDRSLYRPGQTVRIKGLVRTVRADGSEHGALHVPAGKSVHWTVTGSESEEPAAQGDAVVDPEGGWEAQWAVATNAKLGDYRLACTIKGTEKPAPKKGDDADEADEDDADASGNGSTTLRVQDY